MVEMPRESDEPVIMAILTACESIPGISDELGARLEVVEEPGHIHDPVMTACEHGYDVEPLNAFLAGPGISESSGQGLGFGESQAVHLDTSECDVGEPETGDECDKGSGSSSASDDDDTTAGTHAKSHAWDERKPPTEKMAQDALREIEAIFCPPNHRPGKNKQHGYKTPKINPWSQQQLEGIKTMLSFFTAEQSLARGKWMVTLLSKYGAMQNGHIA
ncbi:hypothetical protein H0H87_010675 [Tephrocybe sp. NHM501043]|nr:hypothetical protein H0H87_010675 [Tephrocybe sp. NHM501043]